MRAYYSDHFVLPLPEEPEAQRRIGFPWSEAMVERSRRSVGATTAAAHAALDAIVTIHANTIAVAASSVPVCLNTSGS